MRSATRARGSGPKVCAVTASLSAKAGSEKQLLKTASVCCVEFLESLAVEVGFEKSKVMPWVKLKSALNRDSSAARRCFNKAPTVVWL